MLRNNVHLEIRLCIFTLRKQILTTTSAFYHIHILPISAFHQISILPNPHFTQFLQSIYDYTYNLLILANMRSSSRLDRLLYVPRTKTKTLGPRMFYYASSAVWNSLPVDLRDLGLSLHSFRSKLKSHFFIVD